MQQRRPAHPAPSVNSGRDTTDPAQSIRPKQLGPIRREIDPFIQSPQRAADAGDQAAGRGSNGSGEATPRSRAASCRRTSSSKLSSGALRNSAFAAHTPPSVGILNTRPDTPRPANVAVLAIRQGRMRRRLGSAHHRVRSRRQANSRSRQLAHPVGELQAGNQLVRVDVALPGRRHHVVRQPRRGEERSQPDFPTSQSRTNCLS